MSVRLHAVAALAACWACAANSVIPSAVHANSPFQENFDAGNANHWTPQGGTWAVINREYVVRGTAGTPTSCGFPLDIAQSVISRLSASNVEVEADMRSIQRVDKFLVLRSARADREIFINFRAERPGSFPADLVVSQFDHCEQTNLTPEFSVLIPPHQVGQTIHVHAILIGSRLRILIDDVLVLDRRFPFLRHAGRVGLAGIKDDSITAFDNVEVRYGIADEDGDGVRNGRDLCPGTDLPEPVPTVRLARGRLANTDKDLAFETNPPAAGPGEPGLTLLNTAGCSCAQIIARGNLGAEQRKFGCSRAVIDAFVGRLPPD